MSNQPGSTTEANQPATPPPVDEKKNAPITQEKVNFRRYWPIWAKQLPKWRFDPPAPGFQLVNQEKLEALLKEQYPEILEQIKTDITFMEKDLLRLFRDLDYKAKLYQNRYRLYQLCYIFLAALATLVGSLQGLTLNTHPDWMPWLAFTETIIALLATFLAAISGREPPMPLWLNNRRRAESLRREYFRFLMRLSPYDTTDEAMRQLELSTRAADINRGVFPDDGTIDQSGKKGVG
jgi:hypothetical protein